MRQRRDHKFKVILGYATKVQVNLGYIRSHLKISDRASKMAEWTEAPAT